MAFPENPASVQAFQHSRSSKPQAIATPIGEKIAPIAEVNNTPGSGKITVALARMERKKIPIYP